MCLIRDWGDIFASLSVDGFYFFTLLQSGKTAALHGSLLIVDPQKPAFEASDGNAPNAGSTIGGIGVD